MKILDYIISNFSEYPPTYVGNHADVGFVIERTSNDKKKICEIMIYPYKDKIKIELTTYMDLYVQQIQELDFQEPSFEFLNEFWNYAL